MDSDAPSLQDLRDIVTPDPPSFWPFAPGLWIAIGVAVMLAVLLAWSYRERRRRNAYRRAGLALLDDARTGHEVAVILKRVALATYPREEVASLIGDDWRQFLAASCPRHDVSTLTAQPADAPPSPQSLETARAWIRHHRAHAS